MSPITNMPPPAIAVPDGAVFSFEFSNFRVYTEAGLEGVIERFEYALTLTMGDYSETRNGMVEVPPPEDPAAFKPLAEIKKADVEEWAKKLMPFAAIQNDMLAWMERAKRTVVAELPTAAKV